MRLGGVLRAPLPAKIRTRYFSVSAASSTSVQQRYEELVRRENLSEDAAQLSAAVQLDKLLARVHRYAEQRQAAEIAKQLLLVKDVVDGPSSAQQQQQQPAAQSAYHITQLVRLPRGMYTWGGVGTGKSMLMDLAYEAVRDMRLAAPLVEVVIEHAELQRSARVAQTAKSEARLEGAQSANPPPPFPTADEVSQHMSQLSPLSQIPTKRVHFHAFMLDVHARIHAWKQASIATHGRSRHLDLRPERDAIVQVAKMIASEAWLLCFDEFQVTDVADAMIMSRLFNTLFAEGCVLVTTSNRPPEDLYKDGLNREYFLPFLRTLNAHVKVHKLEAAHDYRFLGAKMAAADAAVSNADRGGLLLQPLGPSSSRAAVNRLRCILLATGSVSEASLAQVDLGPSAAAINTSLLPIAHVPVLMGRNLEVHSPAPGVAVARFDDMCSKPLGAADYQALCRDFHTLVLLDVPLQTRSKHNEARRFVTLVDELYEHRTQLVMTAAADAQGLFQPLLQGSADDDDDVSGPSSSPRILGAVDAVLEQPPPIQPHVIQAVRAQIGMPTGAKPQQNGDDMPTTEAAAPTASQRRGRDTETDVDPAASAGVVASAEEAALGELAFATHRAISRLTEMSGPHYASSAATAAVRRRLSTSGSGWQQFVRA